MIYVIIDNDSDLIGVAESKDLATSLIVEHIEDCVNNGEISSETIEESMNNIVVYAVEKNEKISEMKMVNFSLAGVKVQIDLG